MSTTKMKITRFEDGGHSWFAVKRAVLESFGILSQITNCSYQKGLTVYLEEDCDWGTFLKAYFKGPIPDKSWEHFEIKTSYSDASPVRNYSRFTLAQAPKLVEGMSFKLYDAVFKAVRKEKSAWICEKANDSRLYKITASQLDEIRGLS